MRRAVPLAVMLLVACDQRAEPEPGTLPSELAESVHAAGTLGVPPDGHESAPRLRWRIEVDGSAVDEVLVLAGDRGVRGRFRSGAPLLDALDPVELAIIDPPTEGEPIRDVAISLSAAVHAGIRQDRVVVRVDPATTWQTRVGDCTEIADLTAAALRGVGIDARVVGGAAAQAGEMRAHAWVEYDDDGTWVGIDPTWDQFPLGADYVPIDRAARASELDRLEAIGARVRVVPL